MPVEWYFELGRIKMNPLVAKVLAERWEPRTSDPIVGLSLVSMGLTDRRKTAKNLADSRKNWKILTVTRKKGKNKLTVKEIFPYIC